MPAPTATREGVVNSRRDDAMADILKNREAQIDQELKEGGTAEGIAVLAREEVPAGDPLRPADISTEDWAGMSDEQKNAEIARAKAAKPASEEPAAGETDEQRQAREEQERVEAERKAAEAATAAAAGKKVKIKVDGVEQEVDEAAVLQAGVQTLQKERAADKRLEDAARAKEEAERLRVAAATAAANAQPAAPAKKTEAEMLAEKDALRGIVKAIQYGTPDEAVAALEQYGQRMSQLGQANAITAAELQNMLDLREAQQFVRTNYADVMGDENLKSLFVTKVNAKLAAGDARPYQEICKDVGDDIRTWRGAPPQKEATPPAPGQPGASRAAVHQRKTSTVQVPSAAARQPAPSQPKALSPTDTVAQMRATREKQAGR